jgi:hypothetical protein
MNRYPRVVRQAEANELRARILAHPDVAATELAARLGCGKSTVYKVRRRPEPDRRGAARTRQRASARLRQAQAEASAQLTADEIAAALAGEPVGISTDPYADVGLEGYALALAADPGSLTHEIALVRSQIRRVARQLQPAAHPEEILRLQEHLSRLVERLGHLVAAHARGSRGTHGKVEALAMLCEEVIDGRLGLEAERGAAE